MKKTATEALNEVLDAIDPSGLEVALLEAAGLEKKAETILATLSTPEGRLELMTYLAMMFLEHEFTDDERAHLLAAIGYIEGYTGRALAEGELH